MNERKVLVVEDDTTLAEMLRYNLVREGYGVLLASDGLRAVDLAQQEQPALVILDLMLPKLDGYEVCRRIRRSMDVPILILSARDEELDKVVGLELGADDYVTKPFSLKELIARVRALLRRAEAVAEAPPASADDASARLRSGDLLIDVARHLVLLGETSLTLTPKEFELLTYLVRNRGLVLTRELLLDKVWGYEFGGDTRTVDVHVRWLRQKLEADPAKPQRILTVRGVGYKFVG